MTPLVSREIEDALARFAELVLRWTPKINLIARGDATVEGVRTRHIADSLPLVAALGPGAEHWVDLGSGGGFPALVVAIVAQGQGHGARFTLVESDRRKATFLREAARTLALPVTVRAERAEAIPPLAADVLSARALAALPDLCALAHRHLAPGGLALFPKGEGWPEEVARARARWHFALTTTESPTRAGAALLALRDLRPLE